MYPKPLLLLKAKVCFIKENNYIFSLIVRMPGSIGKNYSAYIKGIIKNISSVYKDSIKGLQGLTYNMLAKPGLMYDCYSARVEAHRWASPPPRRREACRLHNSWRQSKFFHALPPRPKFQCWHTEAQGNMF